MRKGDHVSINPVGKNGFFTCNYNVSCRDDLYIKVMPLDTISMVHYCSLPLCFFKLILLHHTYLT